MTSSAATSGMAIWMPKWAASGAASSGDSQASARISRSAGRQPLLTQAILVVLHHPGAAKHLAGVPAWLAGDAKGFAVLRELLETARAEPQLTTAQLVERWRDRPEGARLAELAGEESLVADALAAGRELDSMLARIGAELGPEKRLNELIEHARERRLTEAEQQEFQGLLGARGPARQP